MNHIWQLENLDEYFELVKRAKANGKKPGDDMSEELNEMMIEKCRKPLGATEMTSEEICNNETLKGKKVIQFKGDKIKMYKQKTINKCMACDWKGENYSCPNCETSRYLTKTEEGEDNEYGESGQNPPIL